MQFKLSILSGLLFVCLLSSGQYNTGNTQYIFNPMLINPAFSGGNDALNVSLFYGTKWVGVDGAPTTMAFSVDAPVFKRALGVGLLLVNDDFGVTKENQMVTNYAYRLRMPNSVLAFGIGVDIRQTRTSFSDLIALDMDDDIFQQDSKNYYIPNFSFGLYYSIKEYFVGVSIPRLLNYTYDISSDKYVADNDFSKYSYLLNTGYKFGKEKMISFTPSLLLEYTSGESPGNFQYDINAFVNYKNRFCLGGTYRSERSFISHVQIMPNNQFSLAYSFNFEMSQLNTFSNGSHEIMLRYLFKYRSNVSKPLMF